MIENIQLFTNFYKIVRVLHNNLIDKKRRYILEKSKNCFFMSEKMKDLKLYKNVVMTSHNSYLSNYQNFDFADLSSVDFLIKLGVRCLEFDVYYVGEKLVCGHGTKYSIYDYDFITTNVISLEDVFGVIKEFAFNDFSDFPLIINLELLTHNNRDAHIKIVELILKYFKGFLLNHKFHYGVFNLGKCKLKHLRKKIIFITGLKIEMDDPLCKYINAFTYKPEELSDYVPSNFILNIADDEVEKNREIIEKHIERRGLVRVYPCGSFMNNFSHNYDFERIIKMGVQLPAINIQQMGKISQKYIDFFKDNSMILL